MKLNRKGNLFSLRGSGRAATATPFETAVWEERGSGRSARPSRWNAALVPRRGCAVLRQRGERAGGHMEKYLVHGVRCGGWDPLLTRREHRRRRRRRSK